MPQPSGLELDWTKTLALPGPTAGDVPTRPSARLRDEIPEDEEEPAARAGGDTENKRQRSE